MMDALLQTPRGLMQGDELITNFCFSQLRPLCDAGSGQLEAIELNIQAPDGIHLTCANVRNSITHQILKAVPTCRLLKQGSTGSIDAYIIDCAVSAPDKGIFFQSSGLHRLSKGNWVFVAGNEIWGDCDKNAVVDSNVASVHLVQDKHDNEHKAITRLVSQIAKNPSTVWPTYTYTLLSSLHSQVTQLGLTVFPALYLVGRQGVGKTMLASRYNLLYDQQSNSAKAAMFESNSTPKGIINTISAYRDQVVLVDDLALGSDPSVRKERQKVMAEVLRFAANGNIRKTAVRGHATPTQTCRVGVVFTGEIPLTAASDVTRMIEVPLEKNLTGGAESDRGDAAAAFRAWMIWLLPHLDDELDNLRSIMLGICGGENARLETSKALLLWTNELFYRFLRDEDVVDKVYYASALQKADYIFGRIIETQMRKVQLIQNVPPEGNLSWYILRGYRKNEFHIVATRKKIKRYNKIYCIVENDALCIKPSTLLTFLQRQPILQGLTSKRMDKQLREEGALANYAEKRAATKRIKGERYLELSFAALQSSAQRY